jgi:hypothetical protein
MGARTWSHHWPSDPYCIGHLTHFWSKRRRVAGPRSANPGYPSEGGTTLPRRPRRLPPAREGYRPCPFGQRSPSHALCKPRA